MLACSARWLPCLPLIFHSTFLSSLLSFSYWMWYLISVASFFIFRIGWHLCPQANFTTESHSMILHRSSVCIAIQYITLTGTFGMNHWNGAKALLLLWMLRLLLRNLYSMYTRVICDDEMMLKFVYHGNTHIRSAQFSALLVVHSIIAFDLKSVPLALDCSILRFIKMSNKQSRNTLCRSIHETCWFYDAFSRTQPHFDICFWFLRIILLYFDTTNSLYSHFY